MRKSKFQKYVSCLLVFVLAMGFIQKPAAAADTIDTNAEAVILVDADTGKILYEKNADTALGIASMTKMMTEYLLLEAVKEGKVKWDEQYTISPQLSKMSHDDNLSNVYLRVDASYTVRDLYSAMAIESANAATVAIAEIVGGTEENFVKMMNNKAEELGLEKYKLVNSSGLNNKDFSRHFDIIGGADEENVMSAKDVAKLANRLLNDFPEVLQTSSKPVEVFAKGTEDEFKMDNWNWMLEGYGSPEVAKDFPDFQQFVFEDLDGLKTGSTAYAGYCFTGTAERDGKRFISVVMKTNSESARFTETKKLLNYAFSTFSKEEIVPKHYQVKGTKTLPVTKGKEDKVKIYTKDAIELVMKSGEKDNFKTVLNLDEKKLNEEGELTAPVKKGEKVGTLTIVPKEGDGPKFLESDGIEKIVVDVVAAENVEKANWFVLMMRGIGGFFGDLWGGITSTVNGWF